MPDKKVIILERLEDGRSFRYALWADVPAARQSFYREAGKKSQWTGASLVENAAIEAGQVIEKVDVISREGAAVDIQRELLTRWQEFQQEVNRRNPWVRYGVFCDGVVWTGGGIN